MWVDVLTCGRAQCSNTTECHGTGVLWSWYLTKGRTWRFGHCNCPNNTIKRRVKEAISITETKETLPEKIWGPGPTTNSVQTYAQKEQKRNFALKFDLLLISYILASCAKTARGTRLINLFCRTSWSNCDLKNKYRIIVATSRCQSIMCSKEKT